MECRQGCAACCEYISISSSMPGYPNGKPAGVRCMHLTEDLKCSLFGKPERPSVCGGFLPEPLICGNNREEAIKILSSLEKGEVL
ncbi:MAG: YkgJ family cysteine cluster protein [Bacteroidota bacterium]|nr:YkgJ family cysteine cluster protein [Bacteroidota bacterium]